MKTHIYILVLIVSIFSLQSCVDSIPIPLDDVDVKLRFESDISSNKGFSARITTSTGLTAITEIEYPKDLYVQVHWDIEDDSFIMSYVETCECYQNLSEKAFTGRNYELEVSSPYNDLYENVFSKMFLPPEAKIAYLQSIRKIKNDGSTSLTSTLDLSSETNSGDYYHILPYRKITEIIEQGGEELEIYTGEIEYLDLIDFDNNNLYLESLYCKPGFLVDFNEEDISSNPLNLLLYTETVIDYQNEALTKVFYEVRSVTESYYRYELYQSRKLASLEDGTVEAPISYSNIIAGLGYFGGYNSVTDSILVE